MRRCILLTFMLLAARGLAQSPALLDASLAAAAPVVLRVQWLQDSGGDKYAWQQVRVLQVLKNDSSYTFTNTVSIAHYSWTNGIPRAMCTVYLERYNPGREDLWKLMGGSALGGVSHIEQQAPAHSGTDPVR